MNTLYNVYLVENRTLIASFAHKSKIANDHVLDAYDDDATTVNSRFTRTQLLFVDRSCDLCILVRADKKPVFEIAKPV